MMITDINKLKVIHKWKIINLTRKSLHKKLIINKKIRILIKVKRVKSRKNINIK